jgi:hypothetical protein
MPHPFPSTSKMARLSPGLDRAQMLRMVDECYAVLNRDQVTDMAVSMDIAYADLVLMFERASTEWEELNDQVAQ